LAHPAVPAEPAQEGNEEEEEPEEIEGVSEIDSEHGSNDGIMPGVVYSSGSFSSVGNLDDF